MKNSILVFLLSLLIVSCDSEDVSYNPEFEGSYLCEVDVYVPIGREPEECIYLPHEDNQHIIRQEEQLIHLDFNSENTFEIDEFDNVLEIEINESNMVSGLSSYGDYEGLNGLFLDNNDLQFSVSVIRSQELLQPNDEFIPVALFVKDNYYCIKQ